MDDIELKNIQLQFPTARTLSRDDSNTTEEQVMTEKGSILVAIQGDRRKPAIMTFHDIGLNCENLKDNLSSSELIRPFCRHC